MSRLRTVFALSWQEQKVLLYAIVLLNSLRLALWLLPFRKLNFQLKRLSAVWANKTLSEAVSAEYIVWCVKTAGRYTPGKVMCLVRALTTQQLLTRYGYEHRLHIGVHKNAADVFEAHAWIESEGHVIIGQLRNLEQFKTLVPVGVKR